MIHTRSCIYIQTHTSTLSHFYSTLCQYVFLQVPPTALLRECGPAAYAGTLGSRTPMLLPAYTAKPAEALRDLAVQQIAEGLDVKETPSKPRPGKSATPTSGRGGTPKKRGTSTSSPINKSATPSPRRKEALDLEDVGNEVEGLAAAMDVDEEGGEVGEEGGEGGDQEDDLDEQTTVEFRRSGGGASLVKSQNDDKEDCGDVVMDQDDEAKVGTVAATAAVTEKTEVGTGAVSLAGKGSVSDGIEGTVVPKSKKALKKEKEELDTSLVWFDPLHSSHSDTASDPIREEVADVLAAAVYSVSRAVRMDPYPARPKLPTPFSPRTEIEVCVPKGSNSLHMKVCNFRGRCLVLGFRSTDDLTKGPAESTGRIKTGDILIGIDGLSLLQMPFKNILKLLGANQPFMFLRFMRMSAAVYWERFKERDLTVSHTLFDPVADYLDARKGFAVTRRPYPKRSLYLGVHPAPYGATLPRTGQSVVASGQESELWISELYHNYKRVVVGLFDDEVEAAKAYDAKLTQLISEDPTVENFHSLNFTRVVKAESDPTTVMSAPRDAAGSTAAIASVTASVTVQVGVDSSTVAALATPVEPIDPIVPTDLSTPAVESSSAVVAMAVDGATEAQHTSESTTADASADEAAPVPVAVTKVVLALTPAAVLNYRRVLAERAVNDERLEALNSIAEVDEAAAVQAPTDAAVSVPASTSGGADEKVSTVDTTTSVDAAAEPVTSTDSGNERQKVSVEKSQDTKASDVDDKKKLGDAEECDGEEEVEEDEEGEEEDSLADADVHSLDSRDSDSHFASSSSESDSDVAPSDDDEWDSSK